MIDSKLKLISYSIQNVIDIVNCDLSGGRKYIIGEKH